MQFERFKQLNHNGRLGIHCEIAIGNILGWRNSEERFNSGIVDEIQPSSAIVRDKSGRRYKIFKGKLTPLVSEDFTYWKKKVTDNV